MNPVSLSPQCEELSRLIKWRLHALAKDPPANVRRRKPGQVPDYGRVTELFRDATELLANLFSQDELLNDPHVAVLRTFLGLDVSSPPPINSFERAANVLPYVPAEVREAFQAWQLIALIWDAETIHPGRTRNDVPGYVQTQLYNDAFPNGPDYETILSNYTQRVEQLRTRMNQYRTEAGTPSRLNRAVLAVYEPFAERVFGARYGTGGAPADPSTKATMATSFRMSQITSDGPTPTDKLEKSQPTFPGPVQFCDGLRAFSEARIKLATNTAAAFQAAAVVFVGQSDGGTKFRDRSGREAARTALLLAVRAMLYDV